VLLIIGAAWGPAGMRIVLWILAVLTHVTAVQRVLHVKALLGRRAE
jgi:hypothetical protein